MSSLAHHGILGMKWGVRRFQRLDGSLTLAGLERKKKLVELGEKRVKQEVGAGDSTRGNVSSELSRHGIVADGSDTDILKKGSIINRYANQNEPLDSKRKYFSITPADKTEYGYSLSHLPIQGKAALFEYQVDRDLKIANGKKIESIIAAHFRDEANNAFIDKKQRDRAKRIVEAINEREENAKLTLGYYEADRDRLFNKDSEHSKYKKIDRKIGSAAEDKNRLYNDTLDEYSEAFSGKLHNKELVKALQKEGYDGYIDMFDAKTVSNPYSNYEYPLVILNPKDKMRLKRKTAIHTSIGGNINYIYGNTLVLGDSSYLEHHGVKGQKWGIRRYQDHNGHLTRAGINHYIKKNRHSLKNVNEIVKTLSDKEFEFLDPSAKKIMSIHGRDYLNKIYHDTAIAPKRIVIKDKKLKPVSFLDLEQRDYYGEKPKLNVSIATKSGDEYRGKGYANKAVKKALQWYDKNKDKNNYGGIEWVVKKDNSASIQLAKKNGFKLSEETSSRPGWVVYEYDMDNRKYYQHSSIGGNMNYIYGNTLVLGDSSYLEHHGVKNQKWGVRRFQNSDGSLTAAGRIRYGVQGVRKATANVGKAVFNVGKTAGSKVATSAKKAIAAKKEKDLAAKKEKASRNRDSVLKNKDLFTSQELAELEKRFKVEDDMKFASMRRGQEIAKTISTYGDAAVKVLNAAQTGGKAVSAISAAMGSMDQLRENRDIRGKAAAEDMSFEDYKAYTKAKTEAKINKDFKNKNSTSSDDDDHDIPVVPVDYDDNPPPGGGPGGGNGPRTPTGGGPSGTDQNRVHRLTGDQQKKLVSFRTKKPKRDEDDIGDVSEDDVNKYKKASKDADSKAKSAQQNADNLKSQRDQLDAAIRNFKLPPVDNPNYDAAAAQLRAAHKQSADLQAAYKKAQSEADSARVAAYNAQREALASEYGGSKGKRIANDMAKKLSDKEYQHAVNAIDSQRESDKSGYDRNVAKAYLKDALNPKNIANRTIDKAAGKIADKAINKQKEALAKERDKQQKQMAENFQRSMKAGTLDASKGIRDYYQREFGLHGAQLDKAVNNYMDSHSGKGSKRTIDLSSYYDKRSSELAKKSASLSNREAAVSEREVVAGQREENIRVARQTLRAASDYLKGASEKVYNDSTIKEEQLHEINEHIRKMMGKRVAVHSEANMLIENNTLIIGDTSSYLEHHGIPGQKWGIRRFQNKDGTRTAAGKKREKDYAAKNNSVREKFYYTDSTRQRDKLRERQEKEAERERKKQLRSKR